MFNYIKGTVEYLEENLLVVDCNGIGYEIFVSNFTVQNHSAMGEEVKLWTYLQVRDDGISLFGFDSMEEKRTFLRLIDISGVGCKGAIQILSGITPQELAQAVANEDVKRLILIKGVGKKTGERIVLELKDKLDFVSYTSHASMPKVTLKDVGNELQNEALQALTALGINKNEAAKAITNAIAGGANSLESIIQKALKGLY